MMKRGFNATPLMNDSMMGGEKGAPFILPKRDDGWGVQIVVTTGLNESFNML